MGKTKDYISIFVVVVVRLSKSKHRLLKTKTIGKPFSAKKNIAMGRKVMMKMLV